jgi:putative transposase
MKFDPKIHPFANPQGRHRRSIRLQGYDYSQSGAYYITIVTQGRECLFGQVINGEMRLNQFGQIVQHAWLDLPNHYPHVELTAFCIMPNHAHGVILLIDNRRGGSVGSLPVHNQTISGNAPLPEGAQTCPYPMAKRHPLSEIVRAFKSFSARRINTLRKTPSVSVWQRNYYEHIIRNDEDYKRIQHYIESNPFHWKEDTENPGEKP